jgi:hypothetical protein
MRAWIAAGLLVVGCGQVARELDDSKRELARVQVRKIANELYLRWRIAAARDCPEGIAELIKDEPGLAADPWGAPFRITCGPGAPPSVNGLGAFSVGPDGKEGTADDVTSWEPAGS